MKKYSADDIQVLTGYQHVRKRPKIYFTECFEKKSLNSLALEATCHAIDEVVDGNCSEITFNVGKQHFSIVYDSPMSLSLTKNEITKAEAIMTILFACKNEKKHLHVGAEFCRIGLGSLNFASDTSKLISVENGQKAIFEFEEGLLINKSFNPTNEEEYTEIFFAFSDSVFPNFQFDLEGVQQSLSKVKEAFPTVKIEVLSQLD